MCIRDRFEIDQAGFPLRGFVGFLLRLGFEWRGGVNGMTLAGGEIPRPTALAGAAGRQAFDEVLEVFLKTERLAFGDLERGQVVIPNLRSRPAFGEKQQVGLDPGPGGGEYPARQADDAPQIAIVQQLSLIHI